MISQELVEDKNQCVYQLRMVKGKSGIRQGTELTISYGDHSNEELLFLYGFVTTVNPNDTLRIHFAAANVDVQRRIHHQLQGRNFLTLPGADCILAVEKQLRHIQSEEELMKIVPSTVWRVLDLFLHLTKLPAGQIKDVDEAEFVNHAASRDLVYTLRVLLEKYKAELEGPIGTGTLEKDIEILQKFVNGRDPQWLWNVCVYRSMHKTLTRKWLKIVKTMEEKLQAGVN